MPEFAEPNEDRNRGDIMMDFKTRLDRHTLPFLAALACINARYTFQTFDDSGDKRPELARQFYGSFQSHMNALESLNRQGACISVTVNETDGEGRSKANIVGLRGLWADIDDKDAKEPFAPESLPLPPSIVVKTPGGRHFYWLMHKPELCGRARLIEHEADLRRIQSSLAKFGADSQVCEGARTLRMPGFYHWKSEPQLVTLESVTHLRYTRSQIHEAFPPIETKSIQPAGYCNSRAFGKMTIEQARVYIDKVPPAIQGKNGSNTTFKAALKLLSKGMSEADALDLLVGRYNPRCRPPWSEEELQKKVHDAATIVAINRRGV
jgi:hypothetical protein